MNDLDAEITVRVFGLKKILKLDTFNDVSWAVYKNVSNEKIDWRGAHDRWNYVFDFINPGDEIQNIPSFSTDLNSAFLVLAELEKRGILWDIDGGTVSFLARTNINYWGLIELIRIPDIKKVAETICTGALKVIDYLEGKNVESSV